MRSSPSTEFKRGQHWRPHKIFRERAYLLEEYVNKKRTTGDLAREHNVTEAAILHWMKKYGIPRRPMEETRKIKKWGSPGAANGMYGRRGASNPNWKGGVCPERQLFYLTEEWKKVFSFVWQRDGGACQRCGATYKTPRWMHVHHIASFDAYPDLRAESNNLVLLCCGCHSWVHSKKNTRRRFLKKGSVRRAQTRIKRA